MFCENYHLPETPELSCNQYEDFNDVDYMHKRSPVAHYKKKGYRKIEGRWYCKNCAKNLKTQQNERADN